ncbi:MAG: hypothetical protein ACRBF0_20820 [Calditrichia bacterium]
MAKATKFGTFGGVFTPSILTILGVIMYLRLPWIVGNAGLWWTLGIIIVAHIISITTGLSVASIATDKKVEAGGNYYIISRSLGLPIGGTLGIALFVGFSFSVSLYIIGFTESFLDYWNMDVSAQNIRVYGTIALVGVTAITLFSTSLAIKMQYVIMLAIVLSLISIVFGSTDLQPASPVLFAAKESVPIAVLFGIFFPAVTGFTTGVQMSGDLQDPKRSIPLGTMAAIAVGFVVYIALAIFLSFRISADALANDSGVLNKISFFAPLLAAGIWGATISSAMGSILGAPRILQATSKDRITPQFFAKGYGPGNDPRNALILTFLIAEIGILVGELNLIARIISIFFITTYGFINLVSALETWAGPDFRPSFKIPSWIGILGAAFCFFVMFELDPLALVGATILLGFLYAYLKRKELTLESGDTWEGIWSSVVRSGLIYLTHNRSHRRNWRPNILLFSGGTRVRPHLMEFGEWMVDKRGILTNFDLIENSQAGELFTKSIQPEAPVTSEKGVFSRQLECNNIYEGMENIARIYGFSGIDPNTIMMGWARNSANPQRFTRMINNLMQMDYNILLLDYDREQGFGAKQRIDIWWRGGSNNATLSLTVLKFLQVSQGWREAKTRILLVVNDAELSGRVYKNMTELLEEQRVSADILVINNSIEERSFSDIIRTESADADLTMIGLTEINPQNAKTFVEGMDSLASTLGNVLMVHASSYFETIFIGIEKQNILKSGSPAPQTAPEDLEPLKPPKDDLIAHQVSAFLHQSEALIRKAHVTQEDGGNALIQQPLLRLRESLEGIIEKLLQDFSFLESENAQQRKLRHLKQFIEEAKSCFKELEKQILPLQNESLTQEINQLIDSLRLAIASKPEFLQRIYSSDELAAIATDSFSLKSFKWRKRFVSQLSGKNARERVNWQDILASHYLDSAKLSIERQYEQVGMNYYQSIATLQKWLEDVARYIQNAHLANSQSDLKQHGDSLFEQLDRISNNQQSYQQAAFHQTLTSNRTTLQEIAAIFDEVYTEQAYSQLRKKSRAHQSTLNAIPTHLSRNLGYLNRFTLMKLTLLGLEEQLKEIVERLNSTMQHNFQDKLLSPYSGMLQMLNGSTNGNGNTTKPKQGHFSIETEPYFDYTGVMQGLIREIRTALINVEEEYEILSEESFQNLEEWQFGDIHTIRIQLRRLLNHLIDSEFTGPLQSRLTEIRQLFRQSGILQQDLTRRLNHSYARLENGSDEEEETLSFAQTIDDITDVLTEQRRTAETHAEELRLFIGKRLEEATERLHPKMIIHSASYPTGSALENPLASAAGNNRSAVPVFWRMIARLNMVRSYLTAPLQIFNTFKPSPLNPMEKHYKLIEQLIPTKSILNTLSFSYRQLFTARQIIDNSLLIPRPHEMQQAETAISRYRNGYLGGLLILGEGRSGRTSLSRRVMEKYFDISRIFQINALPGGSSSIEGFQKHLEERLGGSTGYADAFRNLPLNSVVMINDLELWWQRGENGMGVIRNILEIINLHSKDCFFIVNCNEFAFQLMKHYANLDIPFLKTIRLQPMSSEQIYNAIMLRHRSSGMTFNLDGHPEVEISPLQQQILANDLHHGSDGNIGLALHQWISMLREIKGNSLDLELQGTPPLTDLQLPDDQAVWLTQMILHKQLTRMRLQQLFKLDEQTVELKLNDLKRSQLIVETRKDVIEVNPWLQVAVTKALQNIGQLSINPVR